MCSILAGLTNVAIPLFVEGWEVNKFKCKFLFIIWRKIFNYQLSWMIPKLNFPSTSLLKLIKAPSKSPKCICNSLNQKFVHMFITFIPKTAQHLGIIFFSFEYSLKNLLFHYFFLMFSIFFPNFYKSLRVAGLKSLICFRPFIISFPPSVVLDFFVQIFWYPIV